MARKNHPAAEARSQAADMAAGIPPSDADVVVHTEAEATAVDGNGPAQPVALLPQPNTAASAGKSPPKSKRQRFLDHLDRRMISVRKSLSAVARMGNRAGYEYTDEEAVEIWDAILEGLNEVKVAFTARTRTASPVSWRSK